MKAEVGDEWVADEMAIKVGSSADIGTGTLWTPRHATSSPPICPGPAPKRPPLKTMEKAKAAAGKAPNTIKTDKLTSYRPAITKVFPKTLHIKSQGLTIINQQQHVGDDCRAPIGAGKRPCADWTAWRSGPTLPGRLDNHLQPHAGPREPEKRHAR